MLRLPTKLVTNVQGMATGVAGWASGYNWYKLGIKVLLVLGLVAAVHYQAIYSCERKHDAQEAKKQTTHAAAVVSDVRKRLPEVQSKDQDSTRLRQGVELTGKKLHEAIKANPNSGCTLSDDELQFYRELAEATKGKH